MEGFVFQHQQPETVHRGCRLAALALMQELLMAIDGGRLSGNDGQSHQPDNVSTQAAHITQYNDIQTHHHSLYPVGAANNESVLLPSSQLFLAGLVGSKDGPDPDSLPVVDPGPCLPRCPRKGPSLVSPKWPLGNE